MRLSPEGMIQDYARYQRFEGAIDYLALGGIVLSVALVIFLLASSSR